MPKRFKPIVKGTTVYVQGRIAYQHLLEPQAALGSDKKKYSCVVIIDAGDKEARAAINAATDAAIQEGVSSKWGGKTPRVLRRPLRDGNEKEGEEFQGKVFLSASSEHKIAVLGRGKAPIMDPEEVYSGMWGIVVVKMFPYSVSGNNGVGAGLNAVAKTGDDTPFAGGDSGANAFNGVDYEYDDGGAEEPDFI